MFSYIFLISRVKVGSGPGQGRPSQKWLALTLTLLGSGRVDPRANRVWPDPWTVYTGSTNPKLAATSAPLQVLPQPDPTTPSRRHPPAAGTTTRPPRLPHNPRLRRC